MDAKHTPGPWHRNIKPASKYPVIFAGRNTHVAQITQSGLTEAEIEANCDLIAAAPELLDAAQRHLIARNVLSQASIVSLKNDDPRFAAVVDTLRDLEAAIAKATGTV